MKNIVCFLIKNNLTVSTMESCTGGALCNEITNIEGASSVIKFSAVTYSNEFKIKMGVSCDVIDKYSVYSIETARAMSKCISDFTLSSYGIGITGKLNSVDSNNLVGDDSLVFVSIYDRMNEKFIDFTVSVYGLSREESKKLVVNGVIKEFYSVLVDRNDVK